MLSSSAAATPAEKRSGEKDSVEPMARAVKIILTLEGLLPRLDSWVVSHWD